MKEYPEEVGTIDEAAEPVVDGELGGASAVPERSESEPAISSDFAHWLTGSLHPSASKSVPPPVGPGEDDAGLVTTPETLAPQVMSSEELDEEDLAVLPTSARRSGPRAWLGKFTVGAMGAAAAVLMFGYLWWQEAPEPSSGPTPPAAAAAPAAVTHEPVSRAPIDDEQPIAEPESPAARPSFGRWIPPVAAPADDSDETFAGPRGPSVARFPDLPAAVWSYLKQTERQNHEASSGNSDASSSETGESAPSASE